MKNWPKRAKRVAVARDPNTRRILTPSEHLIQVRLVNELKAKAAPGVFWFAIPNQSNRGAVSGQKMKDEGVVSGVADLCVMLPQGRVAWLEMKKPGGRLSDTQKQFRDQCNLLGHPWAVAYSVQEALIYLRSWGALMENVAISEVAA